MSLAYQGCSSEELSFLVSAGEWKQRLFDRYIERMFKRHSQTQLYSQKQTQRYLIWLAQRMATSISLFYIDDDTRWWWSSMYPTLHHPSNSLSQQLHSLELCSFSKLCYEAHISPKNRRWLHLCPSDVVRAFCENGVGIGAILKKMRLSRYLKSRA